MNSNNSTQLKWQMKSTVLVRRLNDIFSGVFPGAGYGTDMQINRKFFACKLVFWPIPIQINFAASDQNDRLGFTVVPSLPPTCRASPSDIHAVRLFPPKGLLPWHDKNVNKHAVDPKHSAN